MATDPVEEAANLPLRQRVEHSHWKVRSIAYEELQKKFNEAEDANASFFAEYGPILKKILSDKNAVALEKGLGPIYAFYDRYEQAAKYTSQLAPVLIEKCLGARQKTKEEAIKILLLMIEVDNSGEPVLAALLEGAKNKVPKVAAASIATMEQAIKTFGVKVVPVKEILKEFVVWFDHTSPDVRSAATALVVELRRWLGAILDKPISALRPTQVKELETAFEGLSKEPAVPLKYLRSQLDQMMAAASAANASEAPKEIDAYELAEAVNVLSKITPAFYENLASKKWKDRKEQLEKLVEWCDNPRLEPGDYGELTKNLKKVIEKDANVFCVALAARAVGLLGSGLRKDFAQLARSVVPSILEKFKETKQTVVAALHEALERMHPHCFTLLDIIENIETASDHKVPQVKSEMLTFVIKCLKVSNRAAISKQVKPFCNVFMKLMDDSDPNVREKSYEAMGVLVGVVGERTVQGFLNKLDKLKEKRVREFIPASPVGVVEAVPHPQPQPIDTAHLEKIASEVAESKPAPAAAKKKAPATAAAKKASASSASSAKSTTATAKAASPTNPTTSRSRTSNAAAPPTSSQTRAPSKAAEPPSPPEATGPIDFSAKITPKLIQMLGDSDWTIRQQGLTQVEQLLAESNKIQTKGTAPLVNALKARLGDTNKTLAQMALNILGDFATASGPAAAEHMKVIIPAIFNCFTDSKVTVKAAAATCLDKWVNEVTMDAFVPFLHNAFNLPSGRREVLQWLCQHFGNIRKADVKPLIKDVLSCLEDKNKDVRVHAETIFTEIIKRTGTRPVLSEVQRMKPVSAQSIKALIQQIERRLAAKPQTPTKEIPPTQAAEEETPLDSASEPQATVQKTTPQQSAPIEQEKPQTESEKPQPEPEKAKSSQRTENPLFDLELEKFERSIPTPTFQEFQPPIKPVTIPAHLSLNASPEEEKASRVSESITPVKERVQQWITVIDAPLNAGSTQQDVVNLVDTLKLLAHIWGKDDVLYFTHVDGVVSSLVRKFVAMYEIDNKNAVGGPGEWVRVVRYLLNALSAIFALKNSPRAISVNVLYDTIHAMLNTLHDEAKLKLVDVSPFIDKIVVSALSNCDRMTMLVALFKLLRNNVPPPDNAPISDSERHSRSAYSALVVRCMSKLLKIFNSIINDLNVDLLLHEIHRFLHTHPPHTWPRGGKYDPLGVTLAVLDKIVKAKGPAVIKNLTLLPSYFSLPQPIIWKYIRALLRCYYPNTENDITETGETVAERLGGSETEDANCTPLTPEINEKDDINYAVKLLSSVVATPSPVSSSYVAPTYTGSTFTAPAPTSTSSSVVTTLSTKPSTTTEPIVPTVTLATQPTTTPTVVPTTTATATTTTTSAPVSTASSLLSSVASSSVVAKPIDVDALRNRLRSVTQAAALSQTTPSSTSFSSTSTTSSSIGTLDSFNLPSFSSTQHSTLLSSTSSLPGSSLTGSLTASSLSQSTTTSTSIPTTTSATIASMRERLARIKSGQ